MFKPFSWMFKIDNFKEHFKYLFFILIKFFIPAICLSYLVLFCQALPPLWGYVCCALSILLFIAPFLCIQGYFWELTSQIISRDFDVVGGNIYNGKIRQVYKIELPDINTKKFIWRGIASIVANLIMFLPLISILSGSFLLDNFGVSLLSVNSFETSGSMTALTGVAILYVFLAPALLWNYAKRNSIVATLNFPKAVYIAGNYTGKYILNGVLFFVFNFIMSGLTSILSYLQFLLTPAQRSPLFVLCFFVSYVIGYLIYIYCIFVNAYLLGTITPAGEA